MVRANLAVSYAGETNTTSLKYQRTPIFFSQFEAAISALLYSAGLGLIPIG
jgi:hypothetical protein